ncbi:MAG: DUF1987 domain-containing protein [Cyclobacteriaceae bacterium]
MRPFIREAKSTTPYVEINYNDGHIQLKGVSHPENVFTFYNPIFQAIKAMKHEPVQEVVVDFVLEYFNTSSARCLFLILKEVKELGLSGKKLTINWHYEEEDEDMLETGEDFQELIELPFVFVEIEES